MHEKEIQELKRIVNAIFLVNLDSKSRERNIVDARKIYAKMLRDSGFSYEAIGKTIGKCHATIVHYINNVEHILSYDKRLRDKYIACKNNFIKKRQSISEQIKKDADVYVTIIRLANELEEAISDKNKVLYDFVNYIEEYERKEGTLPSLYEYKHTILPLFIK